MEERKERWQTGVTRRNTLTRHIELELVAHPSA
jgi:hypothetical protein